VFRPGVLRAVIVIVAEIPRFPWGDQVIAPRAHDLSPFDPRDPELPPTLVLGTIAALGGGSAVASLFALVPELPGHEPVVLLRRDAELLEVSLPPAPSGLDV
jgi:hypothetical protein